MRKNLLTVRNVDENILGRFKVKAAQENLKMGEALTEAMKRWIMEEEKVQRDLRNLRELHGIFKTKGKVRWSEEIDEILYGWKK